MKKQTTRLIIIGSVFALHLLGLYHLGVVIVLSLYFALFWVIEGHLRLNLSERIVTVITDILYGIRAKYYDCLIRKQLKRISKRK